MDNKAKVVGVTSATRSTLILLTYRSNYAMMRCSAVGVLALSADSEVCAGTGASFDQTAKGYFRICLASLAKKSKF